VVSTVFGDIFRDDLKHSNGPAGGGSVLVGQSAVLSRVYSTAGLFCGQPIGSAATLSAMQMKHATSGASFYFSRTCTRHARSIVRIGCDGGGKIRFLSSSSARRPARAPLPERPFSSRPLYIQSATCMFCSADTFPLVAAEAMATEMSSAAAGGCRAALRRHRTPSLWTAWPRRLLEGRELAPRPG
jgi:hypothetical protein